MKKQNFLAIVALAVMVVFSSCNNYEAKEIKLSNTNDSLNYCLGLANGDGIKKYYLQKDSSDKPIISLMKAIDEAYKADVSKDEMYKLGLQIGGSLKQQKKQGLMGDSTLVFNDDLVIQGLVNALNGYKEGMSVTQADEYIRNVMNQIQQKRMGQMPAPQQ